jgi:hypothetical protein
MKILVLALSLLLVAPSSFAALSNENNPGSYCIDLGSPSADAVKMAGAMGGKSWKVLSVSLVNNAAIAADNSNYVILELKKGSTIVAELDSRAAHENGLADETLEPLNLVTAQVEMAAGSVLSVNYNETDAGTNVALTDAVLCIHYAVK